MIAPYLKPQSLEGRKPQGTELIREQSHVSEELACCPSSPRPDFDEDGVVASLIVRSECRARVCVDTPKSVLVFNKWAACKRSHMGWSTTLTDGLWTPQKSQ